jgi:CubicO group peptidase (beta-lactamase class C family)
MKVQAKMKMEFNIAQKILLILLVFVLLPIACTSADAVSPLPATATPTIQVPAIETATSLPVARTDCASRYPSIPAERKVWPTTEWKVSSLEEHCLDRASVEKAVWYLEQSGNYNSLVIIRHGELVYEKYFTRFLTYERRVQVFSVTKSYLSALVGIAMDQGQLDSLDHKVIEYFPEYFYPTTDPRMKQVTLRHLLTMSAGFHWVQNMETQNQWMKTGNMVDASINWKFRDTPGTVFNYSNADAELLSAILTKIVGEPLRTYAQRNLFSPMGIPEKNWGWGMDDQGYYYGASGMTLRPRDIARFGYLYLNQGYWDGKQVISEEWVRQSTTKQIDAYLMDYGYLWWVGHNTDQPSFEAHGSRGQYLLVIPSLDMVVAVNGDVYEDANPASIVHEWIIKAVTDE